MVIAPILGHADREERQRERGEGRPRTPARRGHAPDVDRRRESRFRPPYGPRSAKCMETAFGVLILPQAFIRRGCASGGKTSSDACWCASPARLLAGERRSPLSTRTTA